MSEFYSEAEAREIIRQSVVDEKLIEEAEKAMIQRYAEPPHGEWLWSDMARAALTVFEKALGEATVTPTDGEREALAAMIGYELYAEQMSKAAGGRPSRSMFDTLGKVWMESWLEATRPIADVILAAGFRRSEVPEPQGEPSDAQVQAALDAYHDAKVAPGWRGEKTWKMRAALRAAGGVR